MTAVGTVGRSHPDREAGTEAAGRVADVLLLFADRCDPLGVSAISRELELSKAVVHRILQSLVSRDVLAAAPGATGYCLGPAAAALGVSALRRYDLRRAAAPVLRGLRDSTGETAVLWVPVGDQHTCLEQFESQHQIRMVLDPGKRLPLHIGAGGKAILAFLPDALQRSALSGSADATPALREELADIRRFGAAEATGDGSGTSGIAAPLLGPEGRVLGAVGVCGPADRFTGRERHRYRNLVVEGADRVPTGPA